MQEQRKEGEFLVACGLVLRDEIVGFEIWRPRTGEKLTVPRAQNQPQPSSPLPLVHTQSRGASAQSNRPNR